MSGQTLRRMFGTMTAGLLLAIAGCNSESKLASNSDLSGGLWSIAVTSPAFKDQGAIPEKFTQVGENISPPLQWTGGPNGTKEYALIVETPDESSKNTLTNWVVYRIPATVIGLKEGASKDGGVIQGKNYLGNNDYAGPNPPSEKKYRYFFQIFALDTPQDIPVGADREQIRDLFKGHVLAKGQLVGTFTGPKK